MRSHRCGGCEECISGSMRYITSSYMAIAFGSRPPWSSLHGLGEDSTASLNTRVLRPKREWFRLRCSLHHKSCIETKYLRVYRVVLYHLTPSLAGIKLFAALNMHCYVPFPFTRIYAVRFNGHELRLLTDSWLLGGWLLKMGKNQLALTNQDGVCARSCACLKCGYSVGMR